MTADEDGEDEHSESKLTKPPATPKTKPSKGNMKIPRIGQTQVLKKAKVVVLTNPREVPCDRCQMKG